MLKTLVSRYIKEGQPVGSRTLSRDCSLDLSPATIRNVMADLEDLGLIISPHTSAGRVPTVQGYRLFVDSLIQVQPVEIEERLRLRQQLLEPTEYNSQSLLSQASALLADTTHLAGVVMLPRQEVQTLRHVEFLSLSGKRVLVILVINETNVQNSIIQTQQDFSSSELQQAANYLNAAFAGKDIKAVRKNLLKEMKAARIDMNNLMQTLEEVATKAFEEPLTPAANTGDYVLAGQTNLMGMAGAADMDKLRHLFDAFNQKQDILHLLDQALNSNGVQIFIGEESGYDILDEYSIVTSPYRVDGQTVGVLGVIGPTRMAYERVIPIVDLTAQLLSSALK